MDLAPNRFLGHHWYDFGSASSSRRNSSSCNIGCASFKTANASRSTSSSSRNSNSIKNHNEATLNSNSWRIVTLEGGKAKDTVSSCLVYDYQQP